MPVICTQYTFVEYNTIRDSVEKYADLFTTSTITYDLETLKNFEFP